MHQSNLQAQVQVLPMGHTIHRVTALCPAALVQRPGAPPALATQAGVTLPLALATHPGATPRWPSPPTQAVSLSA